MGVHPNIHIPKESWPSWTWYAIECIIVIAVSNYLFIGFMGIPFFIWYIGIRRFVLTKFLRNGY